MQDLELSKVHIESLSLFLSPPLIVIPPYPWTLHLLIQQTAERKYFFKMMMMMCALC